MNLNFKKLIDFYRKKISSFKFKRGLKKEKSKLYINNNSWKIYKPKRNKFKIFKSKLEFYNTFGEVKKIDTYYYVFWIFLILSSIYVLSFSHYFSIKNIDIIRQDDIINIDLSYKSIENIRYKPILFQDKEEIKSRLMTYQPNINYIYIRKILPDNIKIILSSYKGSFQFEKDWKTYILTENWVVVPWKPKEWIRKINIKNTGNLWIIDYKKVFKSEYVLRIEEIIKLINEKNSFVEINELNYYKKERELHIISKDWIIIIFDLNKPPKAQVEKLNIFYKKYLSKIKLWIVYIDLRINEKIYYCTTDNEFQCKVNLKSIYD